MKILIAPNAFKNSLPAEDAAEAIERGLKLACQDFECVQFPIGDGGDGTGRLLINHLHGQVHLAKVHDPIGRMIESSFGLLENKTAVIELADASGLRLVGDMPLRPLDCNTFGAGELILSAIDGGASRIILCLGGSATVDAGTGLLRALGFYFRDSTGDVVSDLPKLLDKVKSVDLAQVNGRIRETQFIVLTDVNNPLLGEHGAVPVFGPQKGVVPNQLGWLSEAFEKFAIVLRKTTGFDVSSLKGGGAAGGVAASMHALLGASIQNGIEYFLDVTHFQKSLVDADVVITGEGCIDDQTVFGKGPFGVASRAKKMAKKVIGLAGRVELSERSELYQYFDSLTSTSNPLESIDVNLRNARQNLIKASFELGNSLR